MIRHSNWALGAFLALALAWAPLPFGGVTPWAEATLRLLAFLALALAAFRLRGADRLRSALLVALSIAAFALFGWAQSLPVPAAVAAAVSSEHAALYRAGGEMSQEGGGPSPRLSVAPSASRSAALGWLALAAALLAAAVAGHGSRERRLCAAAILATGLFEVFFGAHHWFSRSMTLWGVDLHFSATRLRGTFVNPNHAALYLEMALAIAFAWSWWSLRRSVNEGAVERRIFLLAPPVLVWLALFAGLAFTGSRAGLLAALGAVSVQGLLAGRSRKGRFLAAGGVGVALLGLAVVAALGKQEGLGRLLATSSDDASLGSRLREYGTVIDLWGKFPFTGSGLGTFRDAFPLVQTENLLNSYWHPHSSLLEVPATTGLVGIALLGIALWLVVRRLVQVLRFGRRSEDRAAGLAALGALLSVAVHETFDFGLTMPGNAFTLAVLVGLALPARTEPPGGERLQTPSEEPRRSRQRPAAVSAGDLQDVQPRPHRHRHPEDLPAAVPGSGHGERP